MSDRNHKSLELFFPCPLASGLHARPASHLAEVANQFSSECSLTNLRNGLVANAKSVLGIISADIRHNDRCLLLVSGADERAAHKSLQAFVHEALPKCDVPLVDVATSSRGNSLPRVLKAAGAVSISGVPISRGIGQGQVVVLRRMSLPEKAGSRKAATNPNHELDLIRNGLASVRHQILEKLKYSLTPVGSAVLQADLAMASDVLLLEKLTELVLSGKSAAQAVVETAEHFIDLLGHSESEYIRQRSADIEEICMQLLEEVCDESPTQSVSLNEPSVLVAESLGPQQLLQLDRRWLKALVLEHSAGTSHAAILARSLGIPTLAAVRNARLLLTPGREIVVDAHRGLLIPQLSAAVRRFYEREQRTLDLRKTAWSRDMQNAAETNSESIDVAANASSGEESIVAFGNGADGIGLFRTEMIFLGRDDPPSEQEQFAIYSEVVRAAEGRPVIIRTLDIGGDKKVAYLNLPEEDNPFLGCRGARIYADHWPVLQAQLRAIVRASTAGRVHIMAPMITSAEEIIEFKAAIAEAKKSLTQEGVPFDSEIKIGVMLEVPALAFSLDRICPEVDFLSIGTNDLSQYFFAADRSNANVSSRFSVRHPAFLRFLEQISQQVHFHQKWLGLCGDMAANIQNLPIFLGLDLDEISIPGAEIHEFKRALSKLDRDECRSVLARSLACKSASEVDELLTAQHGQTQESLVSENLVVLGSTSRTKEEVIQEMVDAFYIADRTTDRHLLEEALWAREEVYSTGLGFGFATPHCKTDAVTSDAICVLRLNDPIHWDAVDGEPVGMVVLLALRDSESATTHMQVFSALARKLMNEEFRHNLLRAETAGAVTAYLREELGTAVGKSSEVQTPEPSEQPQTP
jgi:multiphosphoryl transfer protein